MKRPPLPTPAAPLSTSHLVSLQSVLILSARMTMAAMRTTMSTRTKMMASRPSRMSWCCGRCGGGGGDCGFCSGEGQRLPCGSQRLC